MGELGINYHKVLFTLNTFTKPEDKIKYLYEVKVDVNRIIQCFTRKKFQALKKYATKNIFAEDGCDELTEFLKKIIGYYNLPSYGDRYISDEVLKRHLKEEVVRYQKFLKIIDSEIENWILLRDKENLAENKNGIKMDSIKQNDSKVFSSTLEEARNSTTMRELLENQKKKITWKGSKEDLIHFFDGLFSQQLLNIKSYDEIFSIAAHYFVDESGEPIIVEKSASAKMNLNGPKIPEGYQRYMRSIEKLKTNT